MKLEKGGTEGLVHFGQRSIHFGHLAFLGLFGLIYLKNSLGFFPNLSVKIRVK